MNTTDMYVREKLARIKQDEILRETLGPRPFPTQPRPIVANRKLALALAVLIALVTAVALASAAGFGLPV